MNFTGSETTRSFSSRVLHVAFVVFFNVNFYFLRFSKKNHSNVLCPPFKVPLISCWVCWLFAIFTIKRISSTRSGAETWNELKNWVISFITSWATALWFRSVREVFCWCAGFTFSLRHEPCRGAFSFLWAAPRVPRFLGHVFFLYCVDFTGMSLMIVSFN